MGLSRLAPLVVLALFAVACGDRDTGDWEVTVRTRTGDESSSGGAVITAKTAEVDRVPWIRGEPAPWPGELPPPDLLAIADALFRAGPGSDVVDAIRTPRGTVALVRDAGRVLKLVHFEGDERVAAPAPDGARRLLFAAASPFTVHVFPAPSLAIPMIRAD